MKRLFTTLLFFAATTAFAASIQTPFQFLGFEVGADRKLADYRQIVSYFQALAAASPRVAELPPETRGALEKEGAQALRTFVENGGTLIAFNTGCDYVIDNFNIPVRNVLAKATPADFSVPGSGSAKGHVILHPPLAGLAQR